MKKIEEIFTNPLFIIMIATICCILWGSAFPVLKISYIELDLAAEDIYAKVTFAGIRFLLASILILCFYYFIYRRKNGSINQKRINKRDFFYFIILGFFQTTLQYFFFYNGLANTSGIKSALLNSSGSFFVVLLAHFLYFDDRINGKKIYGLLAGFMGIFLVNWGTVGQGRLSFEFSWKGEGYLLLCGVVAAIGTLIAKKIMHHYDPFYTTGWQMCIGAILLLTIGWGKAETTLHFTPLSTGLLIYSSFLSAIAFSLWYMLLKYNKAGEITMYKFMIPVAGGILSSIFIPGEGFTPYIFVGLILVASGVYLVNKKAEETSP